MDGIRGTVGDRATCEWNGTSHNTYKKTLHGVSMQGQISSLFILIFNNDFTVKVSENIQNFKLFSEFHSNDLFKWQCLAPCGATGADAQKCPYA